MVGWSPRQRPGLKGGLLDLIPEQPCDLRHARLPKHFSPPGRRTAAFGDRKPRVNGWNTHVQLSGAASELPTSTVKRG